MADVMDPMINVSSMMILSNIHQPLKLFGCNLGSGGLWHAPE